MRKHLILALALSALALGCESDDPEDTPVGGSGGGEAGAGGEAGGGAGGEAGGAGAGGEAGGAGAGGMGGDPGGAGGEGGMGGDGPGQACIDACTALADCSAASDACPGITPETRDAFYDACLPTCEANPALRALVNGDDCDGTINTLRGLNEDFDAGCIADEPMMCMPGETYYPGDAWDACISDDGMFNAVRPENISTIPRVASYEEIGDLLWRVDGDPSGEAFIDANIEYGLDEGLGSRVIRRYDSRIDVPEGANCRDENAGELWPDYCVGPGKILPILNAAFDAGAVGTEPRLNARRVEAALLWFLHVSSFKEANSCAGKAVDCDSAWGYYGGGGQPGGDMAFGFGGVVQSIDTDAHEAIMQALLAVRCWRDLDDAEVAENGDLHQQALDQLEPALDRGLAVVLMHALEQYAQGGDAAAEWWAYLEVLGPTVETGARRRGDDAAADRLVAFFTGGAPDDIEPAMGDLEMLFPCP
ncbi:MAG: hypothetical protein ACE366_18115 [Bradymonadia bacterium]